jgi:hypothetical protein
LTKRDRWLIKDSILCKLSKYTFQIYTWTKRTQANELRMRERFSSAVIMRSEIRRTFIQLREGLRRKGDPFSFLCIVHQSRRRHDERFQLCTFVKTLGDAVQLQHWTRVQLGMKQQRNQISLWLSVHTCR